MAIQKVAVVGLEGIGAGVAESLVRAQYHLLAWSPKQVDSDLLEQQGALMMTDLAETVAGAHAVLVCLDGQAAQHALQEVRSALQDGQVLVVLTDDEQAHTDPTERGASLAVRVSGTAEDAAEGKLYLRVQHGDVPEEVRSVLEVLGKLSHQGN